MTTWTYPARVTRVIDADTLVCDLDMGLRVWQHDVRVRVLGVDAPEMSTPAGRAAREYVLGLLAEYGPDVTVVSNRLDSFGRILGDVYFGYSSLTQVKSLCALLLAVGHGVPMSGN